MDRRLISCVGYAWRISRRLDNIEVAGHLSNAMHALATSGGKLSERSGNQGRVISLFEALSPHGESSALPTQSNHVSYPDTCNVEIQTDFDLATTSAGALCELIGKTVQEQVQALTVNMRKQLEETGERMRKQETILNDLERQLSSHQFHGDSSSSCQSTVAAANSHEGHHQPKNLDTTMTSHRFFGHGPAPAVSLDHQDAGQLKQARRESRKRQLEPMLFDSISEN